LITLVYPREVGKADRALATCLPSVSLPRSRIRMRGFFRSRVVKTPEQIGAEILDRLARQAESNNSASSALRGEIRDAMSVIPPRTAYRQGHQEPLVTGAAPVNPHHSGAHASYSRV